MIFVVLGGVGAGRLGGALAAVTVALSFDFFLTKPYLSLSIDKADDFETTILLLIVGLIVGQIAVRFAAAPRGRRVWSVGDLAFEPGRRPRGARRGPGRRPARGAGRAAPDLLELESCRFEAAPTGVPLPRLERTGAVTGQRELRFAGHDLALPEGGVELPVLSQGRQIGRFVLTPAPAPARRSRRASSGSPSPTKWAACCLGQGQAVSDSIFVAVVLVFFAVAVAYVRGCERIIGDGDVVRVTEVDEADDDVLEADAA